MTIAQVRKGEAGGGEALTFDDTAGGIGFTGSEILVGPVASTKAIFVLETAQCRFTIDGTAPTTTVGVLIEVGDVITIEGASDINNFKCIRTGSTSGDCWVQYFR